MSQLCCQALYALPLDLLKQQHSLPHPTPPPFIDGVTETQRGRWGRAGTETHVAVGWTAQQFLQPKRYRPCPSPADLTFWLPSKAEWRGETVPSFVLSPPHKRIFFLSGNGVQLPPCSTSFLIFLYKDPQVN